MIQDPILIGVLGLVLMLLLFLAGMHIAFAAALVGFLGIFVFRGWDVALTVVGNILYGEAAKYTYTVIPLFILMGYFAYVADLTRDVFNTATKWVGHLPGGLAIAVVIANAGFGAISGSSTAAAAIFSKVAIPEMLRYGYDRKLAAGVVAAAGTLASLIPPSALMVLYAILTEQSAGACLIAGLIPGIINAIIFAIAIFIQAKLSRKIGAQLSPASWKERIISLKGVWSILLLFLLVVGGIYFGVFTTTEAAAFGAFGALIIGIIARRFTWAGFKSSLLDTGKTTIMIMITIVGFFVFIRFLTLSGLSTIFINTVLGLAVPRLLILIGVVLVYVILGMFMNSSSMLVLTLPLIFPVIVGLGYDPVWFGVMVIIMCEVGLITPPVALNVFVVNRVCPDIPLQDIYRGVWPFILRDMILVVLLIAIPQLATFLPNLMIQRPA